MILSVLLASLVAQTPDAAFLPQFPSAPNHAIGSGLRLGHSDARLSYFVTPASVEQVIGHFTRTWTDLGLIALVDGDLEREGVVSAFFTRTGLQVSVIAKKHGTQTLGFAVVVNLWTRAEEASAPPERALAPPELLFIAGTRDEVHRALERSAPDWSTTVLERSRESLVLEHRNASEQRVSVLIEVRPGTTVLWQAGEGGR